MNFISYAQNNEDVMLWRALKHISKGFYVDIGAYSPDVDSVTKLFYENGWSGANVEPNPEFHDLLSAHRPRDINLQVAVGDHEGNLTIHFVGGLSTAIGDFAKQYQESGIVTNPQIVQLTTLESLLKKSISPDQTIHFLKIDVEGMEEQVLQGNNWTVYRPWIVLVESTLPMTQIPSYESWEPLLLKAQYVFGYADGLNRFYIACEHLELLEAFQYPPNVFDNFMRSSEARSLAQLSLVTEELSAVYHSTSWRITAPIRWLGRILPFRCQLKNIIKVLLHRLTFRK